MDYVGLGSQIAAALKAADPETGGKRPVDIDALAAEFVARIDATLAPRFNNISRTDRTFEALQEARQRLLGDERDRFANDFTAVQTLWEFLHPHEVLDEHAADYKWLAQVYEANRPTQVSSALLWERLGSKTLALVHGHITNVAVTGTGLERVIVDPDSIEALRAMVSQEALDLPPGRDLASEPVTLEEVLDTIDARIRRRLATTDHVVYRSLAEQIERLRARAIQTAQDSIDFLKEALAVAQTVVKAEKLEVEGQLDQAEAILDPHLGALTQIVNDYKPENTPVIVDDVVRDIDAIVKQVRFTGWNATQEGDRTVRKELRLVLKRYALPVTGPLFDNAYAYVAENY